MVVRWKAGEAGGQVNTVPHGGWWLEGKLVKREAKSTQYHTVDGVRGKAGEAGGQVNTVPHGGWWSEGKLVKREAKSTQYRTVDGG